MEGKSESAAYTNILLATLFVFLLAFIQKMLLKSFYFARTRVWCGVLTQRPCMGKGTVQSGRLMFQLRKQFLKLQIRV